MKKLVLLFLISFGIGFFFFSRTSEPTKEPEVLSVSTTQENTPAPTVVTTPVITSPQTLRIPKLNVESSVESVGLDEKKNMDVPKDYQNVAWYNLGFKVGETGSAVIAGHYDEPDGSPGVFYKLSELNPGDEIEVLGNGEALTYEVISSEVFKHDEVPLEEVFNSTDKKRLNLITCNGVFDKNDKNYSNRLIVYAVLKED